MKVTQVALGRFHHFHLARQLEKYDLLDAIWTGYPRAKLRDETGISPEKIRSYPWFYVPAQIGPRLPVIGRSTALAQALHWRAINALDKRAARSIQGATVLVGLSSGGLYSGERAKALGGYHVCDRGSTHIRFQDAILRDEYARWAMTFEGIDPRVADKEEAEYESADRITIPSRFCYDTFVAAGVPAEKLRVIPYGGRLDRFRPMGAPDPDAFTILFVGAISIRKGVPYLLQAFARFTHPRKRLKIIGSIIPETEPLLRTLPLDGVEFLGNVANADLARHYSTADVMVLPSLEDGFGMVMAEAMACGCPVIASRNTGAVDLFTDGVEGRIVPIRSAEGLQDAFDELAQDRPMALERRQRARARISSLGGYDRYGEEWVELIGELTGERRSTPVTQARNIVGHEVRI